MVQIDGKNIIFVNDLVRGYRCESCKITIEGITDWFCSDNGTLTCTKCQLIKKQ